MNVIKNIGSKGEKLSFSISRSYYVKPCSFVLSRGMLAARFLGSFVRTSRTLWNSMIDMN